jgi:hypothetical protein
MSRARALPTLLLAVTAAGGAAGQEPAAEATFVRTVFEVPRDAYQLHFADLDGDGDRDLLRIGSAGYQAHLLGDDGAYAAEPTPLRGWDGPRIAWDCADLDEDGAQELILMNGSSVRAVPFREGTFGAPRPVLEEVGSWCPRGLQRVRCARDVDGDGRTDLVLPRTAAHRIHLRREEGWSEPIEVAFRATVRQRFGDPEELGEQVSQAVRIPWFTVQDVDGDGLLDVQSETEDEVAFHLATAAGLPAEPTWILDLAAFRAELGPETEIDLDDLFSTAAQRVEWRLVDLDGVHPRDLVVGVGSRLRIWLGGAATGHAERPSQVVSAAGNVVWFFLRQVEGTPLPELQLVRAERVGLARVLRYLVLPGRLNFDLFTYPNEGGVLANRPSRRNKIGLQIPRLLSMLGDDGLGKAIEAQFRVPARRLARGGAEADDVADLSGDRLVVFPSAAPEPSPTETILDGAFDADVFLERFVLSDLDARGDGAERVLDIGALETYEFAPGVRLRAAHAGLEPAHGFDLPADARHTLATRDLTPVPGEDLVVVSRGEGRDWVTLLVRRP